MNKILAIAASDSLGGAGIQADIKVITSLNAHALNVITAVTAQNSIGVNAVHKVPARFIFEQFRAIMDDLAPDAVKIGMLYTKTAVREVAKFIKRYRPPNIVMDPVLKASTGQSLLEPDAISIIGKILIPLVDVVTPNLYEAGILVNKDIRDLDDMHLAAERIKSFGPDVVITGGHLSGRCTDLLYDGKDYYHFSDPEIGTKHTHGSGCVFSTSLATSLADEKDIVKATRFAHDFTRRAVTGGYKCGRGSGPVKVENTRKDFQCSQTGRI
jgi:hydroxymethylpyrimidine/phosphomethylpyrimidine kinase